MADGSSSSALLLLLEEAFLTWNQHDAQKTESERVGLELLHFEPGPLTIPAAQGDSVLLILSGFLRLEWQFAGEGLEIKSCQRGTAVSVPAGRRVAGEIVGDERSTMLRAFAKFRQMTGQTGAEGRGITTSNPESGVWFFEPALPPHVQLAAGEVSGVKDLDFFVACLPPGTSVPTHLHRGRDEAFAILSGEGSLRLGLDDLHVGKGAMLLAKAGTPHGIQNGGKLPLVLVASHCPPHDDADHWPCEDASQQP